MSLLLVWLMTKQTLFDQIHSPKHSTAKHSSIVRPKFCLSLVSSWESFHRFQSPNLISLRFELPAITSRTHCVDLWMCPTHWLPMNTQLQHKRWDFNETLCTPFRFGSWHCEPTEENFVIAQFFENEIIARKMINNLHGHCRVILQFAWNDTVPYEFSES